MEQWLGLLPCSTGGPPGRILAETWSLHFLLVLVSVSSRYFDFSPHCWKVSWPCLNWPSKGCHRRDDNRSTFSHVLLVGQNLSCVCVGGGQYNHIYCTSVKLFHIHACLKTVINPNESVMVNAAFSCQNSNTAHAKTIVLASKACFFSSNIRQNWDENLLALNGLLGQWLDRDMQPERPIYDYLAYVCNKVLRL